jgi:hypothetical protein
MSSQITNQSNETHHAKNTVRPATSKQTVRPLTGKKSTQNEEEDPPEYDEERIFNLELIGYDNLGLVQFNGKLIL